ncbi:hypothetical protein GN958_ATG22448, partial [Phytophthora infestans]
RINLLRKEGVPISFKMLQLKALEVAEDLAAEGFRGSLSIRARTRQGRTTPDKANVAAIKFGMEVQQKMRDLGVNKVYSADQTGSKPVWVRHAGKDKERVAAMLLGDSDGVKYKLYANPTAWWNEDIHVVWLETPFGSLQRPRQPAILIVDDFSGHWTPLCRRRVRRLVYQLVLPEIGHLRHICGANGYSYCGNNYENTRALHTHLLFGHLHEPTYPKKVKSATLLGSTNCDLSVILSATSLQTTS